MPGKPQLEVFEGVGHRIAALLRRHPTVGTAVALGRAAGLSRQTLHRAINEDTLTRETGRAVAKALGVSVDELLGEASPGQGQAQRVSEGGGTGDQPRHARNLPLAVREYLAELRVRLVKGGATDEQIEEAFDLFRSPAVFSFYFGGAQREFNEEEVLINVKTFAEEAVIPTLKRRGVKL
jgi:lambda repressor-like predicted transcriptional regulator